MKKISLVLFLMFFVGSLCAFGATKAKSTVTEKNKVWSVGTWSGMPVVSYSFNKEISGSFGTNYAAGGGGVWSLFLKGDYNLFKVGEVLNSAGLYYSTSSTGNSGTIGLTYGLSAMVLPNFSLGIDFVAISHSSSAGTNSTNILPGVAYTAAFYF